MEMIHSWTMTGDYQSVHMNRNFILNVFILMAVLCMCIIKEPGSSPSFPGTRFRQHKADFGGLEGFVIKLTALELRDGKERGRGGGGRRRGKKRKWRRKRMMCI